MRDEIELYLHHLSAERHASPHTLRSYRGDLEELCKFLGADRKRRGFAIGRVSTEDLRSYAAAKLRAARRATVARKVSAIRGFFTFLAQARRIRRDPAAGLVAPKIEKRLPVFLPIDDTERLLNGLPVGDAWADRDRAMLETLYATGLRVSELVGLDWEHVDFENECVRAFGKGRKERIVPIGEIALDALRSYRRMLGEAGIDADAVFVNRRGRRLTTRSVARFVKRYAQRSRDAGRGEPARPAAQLRDPPAEPRRRPALDPGAARALEPLDHAALHPREPRPSHEGVRQCPSPSAVRRPHGTTILAVRHKGRVVMAGDGQVSIGQTVMKRSARKVRRLFDGKVLAGFAGATADAFTLFEKFEAKLEQYNGNLKRAAVELAKDWRTRPRAAPARSAADRRRPRSVAAHLGQRRRHRARRRRPRHRLGRQLRARRRACARRALRARRARHRRGGHEQAAAICVYTNEQIVIEELRTSGRSGRRGSGVGEAASGPRRASPTCRAGSVVAVATRSR